MELLNAALDFGISGIDTASTYSSGESEKIIGHWLTSNYTDRSRILLTTKVGLNSNESPKGLGARFRIRDSLMKSLERLQTEYVDVLYLHAPDPDTDPKISVETFLELQSMGLIKYFGVCNLQIRDLIAYENAFRQLGCLDLDFYVQNYFNWARRDHRYWARLASEAPNLNLKSVSYGVLARGLFAKNASFDPLSRKIKSPSVRQDYEDLELRKKIQQIDEICGEHNQSIYTFSLAHACYLSDFFILALRNKTQLADLVQASKKIPDYESFELICSRIELHDIQFSEPLGDPFS